MEPVGINSKRTLAAAMAALGRNVKRLSWSLYKCILSFKVAFLRHTELREFVITLQCSHDKSKRDLAGYRET